MLSNQAVQTELVICSNSLSICSIFSKSRKRNNKLYRLFIWCGINDLILTNDEICIPCLPTIFLFLSLLCWSFNLLIKVVWNIKCAHTIYVLEIVLCCLWLCFLYVFFFVCNYVDYLFHSPSLQTITQGAGPFNLIFAEEWQSTYSGTNNKLYVINVWGYYKDQFYVCLEKRRGAESFVDWREEIASGVNSSPTAWTRRDISQCFVALNVNHV